MKKHAKKHPSHATKRHNKVEAVQPIDPKVLDKAADLEMKRRDTDFDRGKALHGN